VDEPGDRSQAPEPAPASRPQPEPVEVDAVRIVVIGTVLWFAAFLALLPFRARLADAGNEIWLWTCLAGGVLGLIGLPLALRHRAAVRRAQSTRRPE
jgi:hypothetical protein